MTVLSFTGSIPELYDRYLGPVMFEPYARELAARLPGSSARVLELAAGTGRTTRHLLAKTKKLVATDLNEPMLVELRRQLPDVATRLLDMQAIDEPAGSFDVVVCQFGLMFVADRSRALAEMHRVLRGAGTLLLTTWDAVARNPATAMLHAHARVALPGEPAGFMSTPFSLSDPAELVALAVGAGFTRVDVATIARTGEARSAVELAAGFVRGNPLHSRLVEHGLDAVGFEAEVARMLARAFGAAPCVTPLSAHILTASR